MYFFKLLGTFLKVNIQMSLAYRADTVINILLNLMWLGWELLSLKVIFSNTETLGGWSFGELIALLGVFRLINTLMVALIWPNTEKFNASVRDGSLEGFDGKAGVAIGTRRGHLRTNAAGQDLNRAWQAPSAERSPGPPPR